MWHAVSSVLATYDPVVYEGQVEETAIILNAGPSTIEARAWSDPKALKQPPALKLEMRAGDQRAMRGALILLHLKQRTGEDPFASVAWRLLA